MASRESFPTLKNNGTNAGEVLTSRSEGDAITSTMNGSIAFSFKDDSGDLVLPQLNSSGDLVVAPTENLKTVYSAGARKTSGSVGSYIEICSVVIPVGTYFRGIEFMGSCFKDAYFFPVKINDYAGSYSWSSLGPRALTGVGQYTIDANFDMLEFNTVGGTGQQRIALFGELLDVFSDLRGYIATREKT